MRDVIFLGNEKSSELLSSINYLLGATSDLTISEMVPFLGRALQSIKIHRLGTRLEVFEDVINELQQKVKVIDDEKFTCFLKEFLFPITLQNLLDDEEDKKTSLFLDGFNKIIESRNDDESIILMYYDILRDLRYNEIIRLIEIGEPYIEYESLGTNSYAYAYYIEENNDVHFYIELKLAKLGLIKTPYQTNLDMKKEGLTYRELNRAELTSLGKKFLDFYNIPEKYRKNK